MNFKNAATAALMMCASATFAQDAAPEGGPPPGGPGGPPPPGILGTINMARAGLLTPYFSDAQFGLQQGRLGASRVRIGQVENTPLSADGIKEEGRTVVLGFAATKMLADKNSFLTFSLPTAIVRDAENQITPETEYPAFRVAYHRFNGPDTMFGASLTYADFEVDTFRPDGSQISNVKRPSLDFRLDYVTKLNDNWGVAGRATYSIADSTVTIFTPGGPIARTQPEPRVYVQADLVGNFRNSDLSLVPENWVLHPNFGASLLRATLEDDNVTQESGSVWATADLVKEVRPGDGWAPSFKLGVEHVYKDDLDNYMDEDTYLIGGVGAALATQGGRFQVGFERRQGLNGNRTHSTLVVAYGMTF